MSAVATSLGAMPNPDEILARLDPEQAEVARSPLGPMCVLAGAGTGKTRAITHRIAFGVAAGLLPARHVLAVTFTARAAGEMRTRLRELGVQGVVARTFHSAALRQLQFFWPAVVGGPAPEVMASKAAALAEASGRLRISLDRTVLRDVASEIEWAKVSMVAAGDYPAAAARARRELSGLDPTAFTRLWAMYEEVKSERNVVDFEDVLLLMVGLLADHREVASQVRSAYRHLVVDEFQDVNPVQHALLNGWLGGSHEICVVGDPSQTIYSFTGATPRFLTDFAQVHPGAATVRLIRNYRSTPQVVGLANRIIAAAPRAASGPPLRLVAHSEQDGPTPTLQAYPDDTEEAAGVAAAVSAAVASGVSPGDIAVLFRTNAQSEAFEAALAAVGISYVVRGGERFFSRDEVRRAMVLLRGSAKAESGPTAESVRNVLAGAGWSERPPTGSGASRERWESLDALVGLADDLVATVPEASVADFVAELERRAAEQHAPPVSGVTLASLHAAKGLEWDTVFLVGCSEGLIPISQADTPESVEEERRLLYVGLTRARRALHLSWTASRQRGGRAVRRPSRFLAPAATELGIAGEVGPRTSASGATRRSSRGPARCRSCGTSLTSVVERKVGRCQGCPATYDEALLERLRTWRSECAARLAEERGSRVPAYLVFTDATLVAIAELRPADSSALARVPGVGPTKLEAWGPEILALLGQAGS